MKEWIEIVGFEGYYQASNEGEIRSIARTVVASDGKIYKYKSKLLKPSINNHGYKFVVLSVNSKHYTKTIHQLVARAFVPNPKNLPKVNHKDKDKTNNNVSNLEWSTQRENVCHSFLIGKKLIGASLVKGTNKWTSHLFKNGKQKNLGNFDSEQQAHEAYIKALNTEGITNRYACAAKE